MKKICTTLFLCAALTLVGEAIKAQCASAGTMTGATASNSGAGLVWSNPGNTQSLDGSSANASSLVGIGTLQTQYLYVTNLGFAVPAGYTVCGVTVNISKDYTAFLSISGSASDNVVQLVESGSLIGSNQASGAGWPYNSIGASSYGGSTNTWGATLLPADVNNASFGVAISANVANLLAVGTGVNIDQVTVTVYASPIVLPVNVESFTATGVLSGNRLEWSVTGADGGGRTVIQRSSDGKNWAALDSVAMDPGAGSYSYTDGAPLAGVNCYRLQLVGAAGGVSYSAVALVGGAKAAPGIRFYPNPFHDMINVSAPGAFTRVSLTDVAGVMLWTGAYAGGVTNTQIPAATLPQGLYFLTVDGATYKVVKD